MAERGETKVLSKRAEREKRSKQNLSSTRNNTIELNPLGEYRHSKIATSRRQKINTKIEIHLFSIRSKLMFKLCSLNQVTDE